MQNAIYNSMLDILAMEESQRLERFRRNWERYYGKHPKSLKVEPGTKDDNVTLNFARMIVDKSVAFLFGKDLKFEIDEGSTTPAEVWLEEFWRQNKKMLTLQKLGLNGSVCGQAFVRLKSEPNQRYPRLIVVNPETMIVKLAPDDHEQVLEYAIQYPSKDPVTGKPIVIRQLIYQDGPRAWVIEDQVGSVENLTWKTVAVERWPWPFAPVVDCQNLPEPNEYWGISDLEDDVLDLNRAMNYLVTNINRIIRFHAHPKTWGKGFRADQLVVAVDGTIVLPSFDATLQNLEMKSDLSSSVELYKRLKEVLHEVSRIPEIAMGKLQGVGMLSGVALEILYQPLLEKTNMKRLSYGELLVEVNRRALAVGGYGEENHTELHWPALLPSNPLEERQVALIDKQLGVSDDTNLSRLGYDPKLEKRKRESGQGELGDALLGAFDQGEDDE